jgi:hypothetical protein
LRTVFVCALEKSEDLFGWYFGLNVVDGRKDKASPRRKNVDAAANILLKVL